MKARITINEYGWYYGEVYLNSLWMKVTDACFTKWGAKRALKKWKELRDSEFEI